MIEMYRRAHSYGMVAAAGVMVGLRWFVERRYSLPVHPAYQAGLSEGRRQGFAAGRDSALIPPMVLPGRRT